MTFLNKAPEATPQGTTVKFQTPGDTFEGMITAPITERQNRDFTTKEPAFWDAEKTRPKMEAVIAFQDRQENPFRLFAVESSPIAKAIGKAVEASGFEDGLVQGGVLAIKFTGYAQAAPGRAPAKQYEVVYTPPAASATPSQPAF